MNAIKPLLSIACFAASAATAAVPRAEQAWAAGDYTTAFAQAIEAAQDGDPEAQYRIAEAYRLGRGVNADTLYAQVWYFRAAKQGHVGAAAELGTIYAAERRTEDARHWLRFASDRGDISAMGALAASLYNAPENQQDVAEAFRLMTHAAASGSVQARAQLTRMQAASGLPITAPPTAAAAATPPAAVVTAPVAAKVAPRVAVAPAKPQSPEAPRSVAVAVAPTPSDKPIVAQAAPVAPAVKAVAIAVKAVAIAAPEVIPVEPAPRVALTRPAAVVTTLQKVAFANIAPALPETLAVPVQSAQPFRIAAALPLSIAPQPLPVAQRRTAAPARRAILTSPKKTLTDQTPPAWRVQVGAFRTPAIAQKAWGRLAIRVASLRSGAPLLSRTGGLIRVQAGAGTRAEANALCRAIRAAHWDCFVPLPQTVRYAQAAPLRPTTVRIALDGTRRAAPAPRTIS